MFYALLGLIGGLALGSLVPLTIPLEYARYSAIAILGIFDSLLGALRSDLQKKYDHTIFLSGLFFNMVFAIAITYLGDRLNLDLYLAAIIVFTMRIFSNMATIRYSFLPRFLGQRRVKQEIEKED